jgi:quercetin dioxygenase-like cupin family protein
MKHNRTILISATVIVILAAICIPGTAQAQQAGTSRKELQRNDLSVRGREVIQVRVDIEPGVVYPKHSHPGEELVYVVEGVLEYRLEGKPPVTLRVGDVLFIPYGTVHSVKNVGTTKASEIATYIVEKGKPLLKLTHLAQR